VQPLQLPCLQSSSSTSPGPRSVCGGTVTLTRSHCVCRCVYHHRYSKMAESSKQYIITQYGISCFKQTGGRESHDLLQLPLACRLQAAAC
jgi:hypothetical protein